MSPFAALGLDEDADERTVKRAYALRLRRTRPDEDPEGFQALHAAYKAALGAVRWRQQAAEADEAPAPPAPPLVPAAPPADPTRLMPPPLVPDAPPADSTRLAPPPLVPDAPPDSTRLTPPPLSPDAPPADPTRLTPPPLVPDAPPANPKRLAPPPLVPDAPPADPTLVDVPDDLFDYAAPRDDGGITFDFDAFLADLLAVTADPSADLGAWLNARMASWPLAMKPTLVPYVLNALAGDDVVVSPEHLAVISAAFGFDDVLSGVDPLTVEQLRQSIAQRWTRHEGAARARRLLARENRRELSRSVRVAGWPPLVAPAIAHILTSPRAARWTALRWLPVPPIARWVMRLLRYISAGAVDALTPPIEPVVLARWQWAERTVGRIRLAHLMLVVIAISAVAGVIGGIRDGMEQTARNRISEIWNEEGPTPQKAVDDYTDFIAAHPPPRSDNIADDVATAMFNKGIVLGKMGRTDEAARAYQALDETFGDSDVTSIRHLVAGGLNNWAYILAERKDYRAVVPVTRKVVARYPQAGDQELGNKGFDVQIAKALINEADALEHLGDREATLAVCRDLLARFPNPQTDQMRKLRSTAQDIMHDYDGAGAGTIAPGQAPFSLQGGQPTGGAATPNWPPAIGVPKK